MGKRSRTKGRAGEQEVARKLRHLFAQYPALNAWRIGHLESSPFAPKGDVVIGTHMTDGIELRVQVKRVEQVTDLWAWLEDQDVLVLRKNRKPWLAVMPLDEFARMYAKAREAGYGAGGK